MGASLLAVSPELFLLVMACVVLLVDVYQRDPEHRAAYWLAQLALLGTLALTTAFRPVEPQVLFSGTFVIDPMAAVLKSCICALVIMAFVYSRDYLTARGLLSGEYFAIGLLAVLGMLIMASAHSFLTVYLGLELLSLSLYSMVAMHRNSVTASEAAMKYFVLGAIASGMLLYGMSILYGVTGTLDLASLAEAASTRHGSFDMLFTFGLTFVIVGIAFKLGVVPFHMWLPDVYQGAPTCVTLFIGSAPKIAAFALAFRLLVDGLGSLVDDWQGMLMGLAILSMAIGNLVAIAQSNLKRMLAYSTIAHMGFLLLGFISGTASGYAGAMFYAIVYALTGLGGFGMIVLLGGRDFESDRLEDMKGLAARQPWLAFLMLIIMFSMAGVPPFAGFWAKWFVLKEVIAAGYTWLAAAAVVFSIIGAYYYLRIVKLMYFDAPEVARPIEASADARFVIGFNGLAVLALGLAPGLLMAACLAAVAI